MSNKKFLWPIPRMFNPWVSMFIPFILSPVVLSVFYWFLHIIDSAAIQQRGLYAFLSVMGGDFVLLPVSWFIITRYYTHLTSFKASKTNIAASLVLGCVSSLIIALAGMYGEGRDWTTPAYGVINFAGVYHSVFMAFMMANYFSFMFDHWTVLPGKTGEDLSQPTRIAMMTSYWWILDIISLFLVFLWNDRLYNRPEITYFQADPVQQIGWLIFLIVNVILTVKSNAVPYGGYKKWIPKQVFTWGIILATGLIISIP